MLGFVGEEGRGSIEGGRGKVNYGGGAEGMEEVWQSGTDRGRRRGWGRKWWVLRKVERQVKLMP